MLARLTYSQNRYTASLAYSVEGQEMLVGVTKSHCKGRTCQVLVLRRRGRGLDRKKTKIGGNECTKKWFRYTFSLNTICVRYQDFIISFLFAAM